VSVIVVIRRGVRGFTRVRKCRIDIVDDIVIETDIETEAVVDEGNGAVLVTGKADIGTVADRLGLEIEPEGFETFGGYLLANLGRVPAVGERFEVGALSVEVLDAERRRIHRVRVRRTADTGGEPSRGVTPDGGGQERA
jgi:CBS domain containing-hemolysin-like protein